jgi:GAF domain-containing protein
MLDAEHERLQRELDHHRRRESELLALYETARDLTATRDVDRVLQAIVRRARQLLSADVGYLSIYDAERGDFFVRSTEGSVSDDFARIRVPAGVGICGLVADSKRPHFTSGYADDDRFRHAGTIDHGVLAEKIDSLLGVPLLADDLVLGVLFVADRYPREYAPQQIALLDSLAAFAAVAMENARLFQESREALVRERRANREIQSAAEVHERLSSLLAAGGDLDDLADVVARELDGRVLVVDEELQPLSWSGDEARTLDRELHAAFERSRRSGRAEHVAAEHAWVASAGGQGGLVLWRVRPLSQAQLRTVERAAVMVALVLLAGERVAAAEHRAVQDLVTALLTSPQRDLGRLQRESERYGLRPGRALSVIALRPATASAQALRAARGELEGDGITGVIEDDIVVITSAAERVADRVHAALARATGGDVTGALSAAANLADLPDAHRRASRSLALLIGLGRTGVITTDAALAPYALLFGEQRDVSQFLAATLEPLAEWDRTRSAELTETLLTYLECGRSTAEASQALHIHPNTLRQRLERITALIPDWQLPPRALEIHLALKLNALREAL